MKHAYGAMLNKKRSDKSLAGISITTRYKGANFADVNAEIHTPGLVLDGITTSTPELLAL